MAARTNPPKRIVVACDGTWKNSDSGAERTSWFSLHTEYKVQLPSNVTRICRAIQPEAKDGTEQIIYYQAGLGTEDSYSSYFIGGYLGEGISDNIREAYGFIARNYQPGDEIFLIGFSRGAFTARSVLGLISDMGLLTSRGMEDFYAIFKDWENQVNEDYEPFPSKWLGATRPRYDARTKAEYVKKLEDLKLSRLDIPIKAVAVWDTVGSLGIPDTVAWKSRKEYSFINTEISPNVENAFQALALDEQRKAFSPTMWEMPSRKDGKPLPKLKQCWFPGAHSNVGGCYPDSNTSDITLAWIVCQLAALLDIDPEYVLRQQQENIKWYNSPQGEDLGVRAWGLGKIWDTSSWLAGSKTRTPGVYYRTDPVTGDVTDVRLQNTREFIHPCVRSRSVMKGLNIDDAEGPYVPDALSTKQGWNYYKPNQPFDKSGKTKNPWPKEHDAYSKWASTIAGGKDGPVYILEDVLEDLEKDMVHKSPEYDDSAELKSLAN